MTQSEMLSRITMFLTLVSASIVSLALVGQLTTFRGVFSTFAIVLLTIVVIVGTLTGVRVYNAAMEDLAYVLGMNRLRAAYAQLDPGIEQYFVTSPNDDDPGITRTYAPLGESGRLHVLGSSMVFVSVVSAVLCGVLVASIVYAAKGPEPLLYLLGTLVALAYTGVAMGFGARRYMRAMRDFTALSPTPQG